MTNPIYTREAVIRKAAEMAADGDDTRFLAQEQSAYSDEIEAVTDLVWNQGVDVEQAVKTVIAAE